MAFPISPGIVVNEYDVSGYVPGVATTTGAIGGVFNWGPAEQAQLVSSEETLAARFGRPTDNNYETFLIASNFLSYSNALFVSRAVSSTALNATPGDAGGILIKNDDDFSIKEASIPTDTPFIAKYPGQAGNGLKISVCASTNAYQSSVGLSPTAPSTFSLNVSVAPGSRQAIITIIDSESVPDTVKAASELTGILAQINIGDFYVASAGAFGELLFKTASKGLVVQTTNGASATINFVNALTLPTAVTSTTFNRRWEHYNLVDRAPGTSRWVASRGGAGDELHIVVEDVSGVFTGTPNTVVEVWRELSRATDSVSEDGQNNFYKTVLNQSSLFLWAGADLAAIPTTLASASIPLNAPAYASTFSSGIDNITEGSATISELAMAYDTFRSSEQIDVSLIIAGRATGGLHGEGIANYIIDNIALTRKDCMVIVSPAMSDVVAAPYQELNNLVEFRNALRFTDRAILSTAYKQQYDRYNNKYRWVAGCGDDAGLVARTEFERDAWWSPAGENRGQYKNIIRLAYNPDKAARDVLYKNDINPVVTLAGAGTMLYGDKTLLGKSSAFDRINVRRLFDVIEKAITIASRQLLFEHNTVQTRARFRNMVEPYLRDIMGRGGITRMKFICDETNNTPSVIDRNEFVGTIMVVPSKSINFITLNFVAVANSLSFDIAIQQIQNV